MSRLDSFCTLYVLSALVAALTFGPAAGRAADVSWVSPVSGNWTDGSKWSTGLAPGPGDNALITVSGTYTVTLNVAASIEGLTLGGEIGTQTLSGTSTLSLGQASFVGPHGLLSVPLAGPGPLRNGGTVNFGSINTDIINEGTLVGYAVCSINGSLTQEQGAVFRLMAGGVHATCTVANGFTNHGLIDLNHGAGFTRSTRLALASGTLVNSPTGEIRTSPGIAGGGRTITAEIDNQGVINVGYGLLVNGGVANHVNSGEIHVSLGTLTIQQSGAGTSFINTPSGVLDATGGNVAFSQPADGVFTNAGSIAIATTFSLGVTGGRVDHESGASIASGSTISVTAGTFNHAAGASIGAASTLLFVSSTCNLTPDVSDINLGFSPQPLLGSPPPSILNGPGTVTISPGRTLNLAEATSNVDLINQGTIASFGRSNLNGSLVQAAGSVLHLDKYDVQHGILTIANGFTNDGLIHLDHAAGFARDIQLIVTNGTLINSPIGEIRTSLGQSNLPARQRNISAEVENNGTINIDHTLFLTRGDALHVNRGEIHIVANQALYLLNGEFFHNDATINGDGLVVLDGVTLYGTGEIGVDVTTPSPPWSLAPRTYARVRPGDPTPGSTGILRINGDFSLVDHVDTTVIPCSAVLDIDLAGPVAGSEYDQLVVTGLATLEGHLNVVVAPGFVPCQGFTIALYDVQTGSFRGGVTGLDLPDGRTLDPLFNAQELLLEINGDLPQCTQCTIDTASLPPLAIGEPADIALTATCTNPPISWSIVGGSLPPGMALGADGILSGTPSEAGEFVFTVHVEDTDFTLAEKTFTQVVSLTAGPRLRLRTYSTRFVTGRVSQQFVLVENVGGGVAENVRVLAGVPKVTVGTFPNDRILTFLSAAPTPEEFDTEHALWSLPALIPGETVVLTSSAFVEPTLVEGPTPSEACIFYCSTDITPADVTLDMVSCVHQLFDTLPCAVPCETPGCGDLDGAVCSVPGTAACLDAILRCSCCLVHQCGLDVVSDIAACGVPLVFSTTCGPVLAPADPNEKGVIARRFIRSDQLLVYPVHFENIGNVEALDVFIADELDATLDATTLTVLSPGASFDPGTRILRWDLLGINLPAGEGDQVLFSIRPLQGLPSGTTIPNQATIQFEALTPLTTNEVVNIIDDVAPTGTMDPLPPTSPRWIALAWAGTDPVGQIDYYEVFVSVDGGGFSRLVTTRETSMVFVGEPNRTYSFICLATDTAGNFEVQDPIAEVVTTTTADEDMTPPVVTIGAVVTPTTSESQVVSATVTDPVVLGVMSFVASVTINGQEVQGTGNTYSREIQLVDGLNPVVVVATDHAGNQTTETVEIVRIPPVGNISGVISANGAGLGFVMVDVVADDGVHIAFTSTDATGAYAFTGVPQGPANVFIVVPLGYHAIQPVDGLETVEVIAGQTTVLDFTLEATAASGAVRGAGYWSHQARVHMTGRGHAQETLEDMSGNYPTLIFEHFHENELNGIAVENVTFLPGPTRMTLEGIYATLEIGNAEHYRTWLSMNERSNRAYLALLLNVASGRLSTRTIVSEDSATCSQTIQHVAQLIVNGDWWIREVALDICETINDGHLIPAGVIDRSFDDIPYKSLPQVTEFIGAGPTPARGPMAVRFNLARPEHVSIRVYAVSGRLVDELVSNRLPAGRHVLQWDGRDPQGRDVAAGIYFLRARLGQQEDTRKVVVLR